MEGMFCTRDCGSVVRPNPANASSRVEQPDLSLVHAIADKGHNTPVLNVGNQGVVIVRLQIAVCSSAGAEFSGLFLSPRVSICLLVAPKESHILIHIY